MRCACFWQQRLRRRTTIACTVAVSLTACGTDPVLCLPNIAHAITVRALEAETGRNVTDGARGTVVDGSYIDSLRPTGPPGVGATSLSAAEERPGTYDVFLERNGYQSVSRSDVRVVADECHVHTVLLDLTMVPIP